MPYCYVLLPSTIAAEVDIVRIWDDTYSTVEVFIPAEDKLPFSVC